MIHNRDDASAVLSRVKRETQPTEVTLYFSDEMSYDEFRSLRNYIRGYAGPEYGIIASNDRTITLRKTVDE